MIVVVAEAGFDLGFWTGHFPKNLNGFSFHLTSAFVKNKHTSIEIKLVILKSPFLLSFTGSSSSKSGKGLTMS